MSQIKYLGCVLDELGTDCAKCHRKVARRWRVGVSIRSLVNARSLQLERVRMLLESLLVPLLLYGCVDNFRGLLGIRRMDTILNA